MILDDKIEILNKIKKSILELNNGYSDSDTLIKVLKNIESGINEEIIPLYKDRGLIALINFIINESLEEPLKSWVEDIYLFYSSIPNGFTWKWSDKTNRKEIAIKGLLNKKEFITPTIQVAELFNLKEAEPINDSIINENEYDDSLFNLRSILSKISSIWYIVYDEKSKSELSNEIINKKNKIEIYGNSTCSLFLAKVDLENDDILFALVEQYELNNGIALFSSHNDSQENLVKLKDWNLNCIEYLLMNKREPNEICNAEFVSVLLGSSEETKLIESLFEIISVAALRFEYNEDSFTIYLKKLKFFFTATSPRGTLRKAE